MEKRLLELKEKTEALQTQNDYLGTCLVWDDVFLGLQWEWRGKKYDLMNFCVISATNFKQVVPTEQWAPCLLVLCFSIFLHAQRRIVLECEVMIFWRLNSQQQVCWVQNTCVVEIWGFVHQWIVTMNSTGQHNLSGEPPNESHWIFWLMGEIGLWPESDSKTGKTKNQNEACEQWSKPTPLLAVYRGLYYPVI